MSDPVQAAVIVGIFNLVGIVISRFLSHGEHKQTARDVREIKRLVNGQ